MLNLNVQQTKEKKILLVDDEEAILDVLETVLSKEGFQNIHRAMTGLDAVEKARTLNPNVIILDIMLPDIDGYEVCRRIREFTYAPILFVSAKADDVDKLLGLGMGGDDYITKPFSPKEVAYRIKALFRRMGYTEQHANSKKTPVIMFGDIEIDQTKGEVKKAGEIISLTALEYQLLLFFVQHPNQILSKETITERVWGERFNGNDNALMVHIHHLRQKIETDTSKPTYILTQRGLGYKFQPGDKR